jgi:Protein of unknown function (DUF664)
MNIAEGYDYLVRARRDLWATLEGVGDEVLSRQLLNGAQMHCVKDIVFHVVSVEDFWMQGEILRRTAGAKEHSGLRGYARRSCVCGLRAQDATGLLAGGGAAHPHVPGHADGGRAETGCECARQTGEAVYGGRPVVELDYSRGAACGAD